MICKFPIENPAIFCHFWGQKYTSKSINFSIFGRDFGRILDILPYYTDIFFSSQFLIFPQKYTFSRQKVQKNWKSKNGVKTALTPLFKELWAIFDFVKLKNQISPPKKIEKPLRICNFLMENPAIFCHFWDQKYTSKSIDISNFWTWFWTNFGYFTQLYWWPFLFNFGFFPQKNRILSQKVQKNWKSKNGVKTALTPLFKELWAIFGFVKFKN